MVWSELIKRINQGGNYMRHFNLGNHSNSFILLPFPTRKNISELEKFSAKTGHCKNGWVTYLRCRNGFSWRGLIVTTFPVQYRGSGILPKKLEST